MEWYQNMTGPQKKDFYKVLGVSIIGVILIFLIPAVFHLVS